MRLHGLLAPRRLGPPNGDPAHAGTITTTHPDEMWGTDATRFYTEQDGWCWFFGAIDHAVDEIVGWHTAKIGDRWAALEPIRQGVRHAFGAFGKEIARGLRLRCDWGPHYIADAWINEVTLHHPYQSGCRERRPRRGHLQHRLHPWVEPDHDHGGLKGRAAADSRPDAPSAHEHRPRRALLERSSAHDVVGSQIFLPENSDAVSRWALS